MELKGKKVLVVGLGKSGLAAALFLRRRGAQQGYGPHKAEKSIRTSDRRYLSTGSRSSARVRSSALGRV